MELDKLTVLERKWILDYMRIYYPEDFASLENAVTWTYARDVIQNFIDHHEIGLKDYIAEMKKP